MAKIMIVTHRLFHNYGGILQAMALQKALRELGHEAVTVDYCPHPIGHMHYCMAQLKTVIWRITGRKNRKFFKFPTWRRCSKAENFLQNNLFLTGPVRNYGKNLIKKYQPDLVVVGSDQVWRREFNGDDLILDMFLRFVDKGKCGKISYAASFGINDFKATERELANIRKLVSEFTAVSTRERSGVNVCKNVLLCDALYMPDPTLLIQNSTYRGIMKEPNCSKDHFVFGYFLDCGNRHRHLVERFATMKGCQSIVATSEKEFNLSVEEWLWLIDNASFVATNSFHGALFSIIFCKDFLVVRHKERGDERLECLLEEFGLEDRLIVEDVLDKISLSELKPIDTVRLEKCRDQLRKRGLTFLKLAIAGSTTEEIRDHLVSSLKQVL